MPHSKTKVNISTLRCFWANSCSCGHNFIGEEKIVKMKIKLHHKVCDGVIHKGNVDELRKSFQSNGINTTYQQILSANDNNVELKTEVRKWLGDK